MSTVSKLGDCYSQKANLTHPYGLQECPTKILLPTTSHAAVDLPVDDDQRHPSTSYTVVDPANDDVFSAYLAQWGDCNDEEFDSSSELNAIATVCERMQQQWPTVITVVTPNPPTATKPSQQSLMPLPHWCDHNDEDDDHPSEIDALVAECDRLQRRWQQAMTTTEPTLPEPNPNQQSTEPNPRDTLTYLEEFINSDMEDNPVDQPTAPDGHRPTLNFNAILVLQTKVMAKLIVMIGNIIAKIDLLLNATTCPKKRKAFQSSFVTSHIPICQPKPVPTSHIRTYKKVIPAKPPFPCGCRPPPTTRKKDSMRPP